MVISNTEVDHSGKTISSRSAEPGDKNQVSELIWVAPDKIVPGGAPERARINGSLAASSGSNLQAQLGGFLGFESQRLIGRTDRPQANLLQGDVRRRRLGSR